MPIMAFPFPVFQPAMRIISAITQTNPAVVTTTFDHQYVNGIIIRLNIPRGFGMEQAEGLFAPIIVLSPTTFSIDIDATHFEAFALPAAWPDNRQYAQTTAVGEINSMLTAATRNVLPY